MTKAIITLILFAASIGGACTMTPDIRRQSIIQAVKEYAFARLTPGEMIRSIVVESMAYNYLVLETVDAAGQCRGQVLTVFFDFECRPTTARVINGERACKK